MFSNPAEFGKSQTPYSKPSRSDSDDSKLWTPQDVLLTPLVLCLDSPWFGCVLPRRCVVLSCFSLSFAPPLPCSCFCGCLAFAPPCLAFAFALPSLFLRHALFVFSALPATEAEFSRGEGKDTDGRLMSFIALMGLLVNIALLG